MKISESYSERQMPCGACPAGVYDYVPWAKGHAMFGGKSRKEALKEAPRCKRDSTKICMGCRDFILCHAENIPTTPTNEKEEGWRNLR